MRRLILPLAILFACMVIPTAALRAQGNNAAGEAGLAAIDSLIARSRFRDAVTALDRWERGNAAQIKPAQRATALLLRARLTVDADSARSLYESLSLGYPSSPEAAVALLRLGQLAHARNDMTRANGYFDRVLKDYPDSPLHAEAQEWLKKSPAPRRSVRAPASTTTTAPSAAAAAGPFTLQIGAFREKSTANTVAQKLTKQGFAARVVYVKGSALARVRVGRFATSKTATDDMRRLRTAGYEAVIVDDARAESDSPS